MLAWSQSQWAMVAMLAGLYVLLCVRIALHMSRRGRSGVRWFFVSLLLTGIPAAVVILRDRRQAGASAPSAGEPPRRSGASGDAGRRCPHCGTWIAAEPTGPDPRCPRCRMSARQEDRLA